MQPPMSFSELDATPLENRAEIFHSLMGHPKRMPHKASFAQLLVKNLVGSGQVTKL